jgi:2,4-diketo-3-deoxy-L-fuconate hydrolase
LIESLAIAPPEKALTFARTQNSLIGVQSYSNGIVSGVDLSLLYGISDPIELFKREGYQHLMRTLSLPADISVSLEDLIIPVTLSSHHIAAAGNFPEHAEEAGIRNEPYLFAKRVEPSQSRTTLSVGQALLDYEVELAWVTLYPLEENDRMPDFMGMIAVNDFTDRAELLHSIDPYDVESGQGFSHGKSFPGYLPVGELFVVPADYHEYASQRVLKLFVNGSLRQNLGEKYIFPKPTTCHSPSICTCFSTGNSIQIGQKSAAIRFSGNATRRIAIARFIEELSFSRLRGLGIIEACSLLRVLHQPVTTSTDLSVRSHR